MTAVFFIDSVSSPFGRIWFASNRSGLVQIRLPPAAGRPEIEKILSRRFGPSGFERGGAVNERFRQELEGYFSGTLRAFRTPCFPSGTPFQEEVWALVSRIRYGQTQTYGDIARALGKPGAARAVGQANGRNPLPLIIPCHRVVAYGGGLGGYSSGIDKKRWLLRWEQNRTS